MIGVDGGLSGAATLVFVILVQAVGLYVVYGWLAAIVRKHLTHDETGA